MNRAIREPMEESDSGYGVLSLLFQSMGVEGVYARTQIYEEVADGLQRLITRHRPSEAEVFRFPPVMSRRQLEKSGYLRSFPHLLGCVCCLHGSEADILSTVDRAAKGDDWTSDATSADLVLSPAACYPVYPLAAARGVVPAEGYVFDVAAECFRHEPSRDLDRLQSFRMREFVRVGASEQVMRFRREWMDRAEGIAATLGLPYGIEQANDPFFGRSGQVLAAIQLGRALKYELTIPIRPDQPPTACMSFNYHHDHFSRTWKLADGDGVAVDTGCTAFGIDRLAVALFATHGLETAVWPAAARESLDLTRP